MYQRTLGVDHIDFSVLDNFIADDGYDDMVLKDSYVRKALTKGSKEKERYNSTPKTYVRWLVYTII